MDTDNPKLRQAAKTREKPPLDRHIIKLIGVVLLLLWLPVIVWLVSSQPVGWKHYSDSAVTTAAVYYAIVGIGALCTGMFSLLYACVAWVRKSGRRSLHFGQMCAALAALGSVGLLAFVSLILLTNPG